MFRALGFGHLLPEVNTNRASRYLNPFPAPLRGISEFLCDMVSILKPGAREKLDEQTESMDHLT